MSFYCLSKLGGIPLKWNNEKQRLVFRSNDTTGLTSKRKLYIQYSVLSVLFSQGLYSFYLNSTSHRLSFTDNMVYGLVLFALFTGITVEVSSAYKASSQFQYINGILEFSKNIKRSLRNKSIVKKMNFALAANMPPATALAPFLVVYGLHWFSPCKPSLAGYFLIPECSPANKPFENTVLNFGIKMIIFMCNHWSWAMAMFSCAYCNCCFLVLGAQSFVDFLHTFEEKTKDEREINIYQSGFFYRQIQILGCLCNEVQQYDLLVVNIVGGTFVLIATINAALLVPWTLENAPGLLVFAIFAFNIILFLLFCVGTMAEIFEEFQNVLDRLKRPTMKTGKRGKVLCLKWREKFYLSCLPIKFKFGQFNFAERLTPLNCIMFAINQSVSILLLGKEY